MQKRMNRQYKNNIKYVILILIFSIPSQFFCQSEEILIGVDSESVIIHDIEDIHLKPGNENLNSVSFDMDSNGNNEFTFSVKYIYQVVDGDVVERQHVYLESFDKSYYSYIFYPDFEGPCDSVYESGTHLTAREHLINTVFSISDSIYFIKGKHTIVDRKKLTNADTCIILYTTPHWFGKEGYIGFKKSVLHTNTLGWFKVEVLDYDEIVIKEYAYTKNENGFGLVINEIMASNKKTIADEYNEFDDWIEIYNASNEYVWLGESYLTDNLLWPDQWQFPDTTIVPGGYLLLWADNQPLQGKCHTNFKLDKDGEDVGLYSLDLTEIDAYTFGEQSSDVSAGLFPNGDGEWVLFDSPTPGKSNEPVGLTEKANHDRISFFPNPASGNTISFNRTIDYTIYDSFGRIVLTGSQTSEIDISKLHEGLYFIKDQKGHSIKLIRH